MWLRIRNICTNIEWQTASTFCLTSSTSRRWSSRCNSLTSTSHIWSAPWQGCRLYTNGCSRAISTSKAMIVQKRSKWRSIRDASQSANCLLQSSLALNNFTKSRIMFLHRRTVLFHQWSRTNCYIGLWNITIFTNRIVFWQFTFCSCCTSCSLLYCTALLCAIFRHVNCVKVPVEVHRRTGLAKCNVCNTVPYVCRHTWSIWEGLLDWNRIIMASWCLQNFPNIPALQLQQPRTASTSYFSVPSELGTPYLFSP